MDDESARLRARRIEAGRRALAGATNDDGSSSSLHNANARMGKERTGRKLRRCMREEERRSDAMANAWKLTAGHSRRYGIVVTQCQAQWRHYLLV